MPSLSAGVCVLSIDLFQARAAAGGQASGWHPAVAELCDRLNAADLPATWALAAGDLDGASEALATRSARDEVALIAEPAWAGERANRGQFAAGLEHSLAAANAAGHRPTTLVFHDDPPALHDDLLGKYGITSICRRKSRGALAGRDVRNSSPQASGCFRPLRWGLWELDGALDVLDVGLRRTLKAVDRAAREFGEVAIVINAFKAGGGLNRLARLFDHVSRLRGEGALVTRTIRDVVSHRMPRRQTPAARSILRNAA